MTGNFPITFNTPYIAVAVDVGGNSAFTIGIRPQTSFQYRAIVNEINTSTNTVFQFIAIGKGK